MTLKSYRLQGSWMDVSAQTTKGTTALIFYSSSVTALYLYLYFPVIMIAAATKWRESEVAQSCLTLCDPMDGSLSGSTVHGILQARVLERAAIPFSRESSQPRDRTQVSCIAGRRFTVSSYLFSSFWLTSFGIIDPTLFHHNTYFSGNLPPYLPVCYHLGSIP